MMMLLKAAVPVVLLVMSDNCSQLAITNSVLQLGLFLLTSNLPALITGTNINKKLELVNLRSIHPSHQGTILLNYLLTLSLICLGKSQH